VTRHASGLAPDPAPAAALRLEVAWPVLVACGDQGLSCNSLADAPDPAPDPAADVATPGPSRLRRMRIVATAEADEHRPGVVRFALDVEEDGRRRPVVAAGERPGDVEAVGNQLHVRVDRLEAERDGALPDPDSPLLTIVTDLDGRPLMVRADVVRLAGLGPGGAGRPNVTVTGGEPATRPPLGTARDS